MQRIRNTKNPTRELWLERLGSALRTILACSIVGCTTLYGPVTLQRLLAYPAFSYVTTVLIVSDATLGSTLRGFWHAFYATLQVTILSALGLWLVGPARFTNGLAAAAVALSAFAVALPESTHLMTKRLAFGQIVIVYVGVAIQGAETEVTEHLIQVASSAALGAMASVLAMFFPCPRLAYNEDGMLWERPSLPFFRANCMDLGEMLQEMEIPIRGMEIALTSCQSFPVSIEGEEELRNVLRSLTEQMRKLEQAKCFVSFGATAAQERAIKFSEKFNRNLENILITPEDLQSSFFIYCTELLNDLLIPQNPNCTIEIESQKNNTEESRHSEKQVHCIFHRTWRLLNLRPTSQNLVFAFKCSVSLGLAVLLGLIYNKENGYWSGLTIAITFATGRHATFSIANARAQGTAMGSVYGILCNFILQKHVGFRLLPLLPWIIFTSFLRHSQMYGQAGGISAAIGALLILGRKNYGPPGEFAIARITEASIGLVCFIMVEILVHPIRAATLAKTKLSRSFGALQGCFKDTVLHATQNTRSSNFPALREKQKKLRAQVNELEKLITEAELEPNFWFLSFPGDSYKKLLGSLLKMVDLLLFASYTIEFLSQVSSRAGVALEDLQEHISNDLELFKKEVGSTLKCLEQVTSIKSLAALEKKLQKKNTSQDIELGKSSNANAFRVSSADEEEVENIVSSFLQHSSKVADKLYASEGEDKLKNKMVLCLCGLGFSINTLMKETMKIEKEVKELVKWENPSSHINLYEISCKVNALHT
ncbi:hypothetical protein FH972_017408 [Carpinus fangiana]|uniref:Uncharacterized protein n=1 Tax=Carpinus fangiana TaxID=176857 RepID=A0A5N6RIV1_9ROSI|nr:hypothetical protein FH972_017408 [Carpinus fangiana]